MPSDLPGPATRWRCSACGNLTRFDVTRSVRTTEYWHVDLAGAPTVESSAEDSSAVESVRCRWCGSTDAVTLVPRSQGPDPDIP